MDAKQFLAEFGHIASSMNGVIRLREMVLQLAISGKLIELNESASDNAIEKQITEAQFLKNEYEKKHKLRKSKIKVRTDSHPYKIPNHWRWKELDTISLYIQRGKSPKYAPISEYKVISQKCIQWSGFDISVARNFNEDSLNSYGPERFLKKGDLLWNSTGTGTVGRVCLFDSSEKKACADSHVTVIRLANFNELFIWCVIASPWVQQRISPNHPDSLVSGTTQQVELNTSIVKSLPIPCPPIEEQARIVAKVDELMDLCDKLEEQQQQKRKLQNQLRQTTLQAVATATSPFELKQHWQRLQDNFEQLFATSNDVEEFSAHIKELAVQGLLTVDKKYRPDINSIKAACSEVKESYISRKLMRKQKLVSIAECSVVYPENWDLQAFDEIAIVIGGVTKGRKLQGRTLVNCPYLAVANVQRGFFKLANVKTIDIPVDELEKYIVQENDLLITEGGDWDKVGRTAIWKENIENCIHQNHIFKARLPSEKVLNSWVELVFNSNVGRDYFAGASKQTTNLASINMTQLRSFPFPIPPIEQQIEILEVVESLEKICQSWRKKYIRLNELSSLLASTSVSALTGIDAPKEEESLKTPITELVAPISLGPNKPTSNDSAPLSTILVKQNCKINANDLWQRFGGEIDAFYAQLKTEINHGWIAEPTNAEMLEKDPE